MASANGPTPDHLDFLRSKAEEAKRWGFLALLRRAEARADRLPRIGRSRLPNQNIADMAHAATLEFPSTTLQGIETARSGRMRVRGLFFGLTGPMGALPLHLTEYAFYERRTGESAPFGRWLDVLTDRMMQFFYRAWADTQPAAQADRPSDDRFSAYLAALTGAGGAGREQDAFTRLRQLHYAGAFASRRSPAMLRDALSHMLRRPVRVREFIGRWRHVEPADRSRLGSSRRQGAYNSLGRDTMLGARVRQAEDTFRVMVCATSAEDYRRLLPGQPEHQAAREALDALKPSELDWELELELDERHAPASLLDGASPLGLMSWLAPRGREGVIRADARIRN